MAIQDKSAIQEQLKGSASRLRQVNEAAAKAAGTKQQGTELPATSLPQGPLTRRS